MLNITMDLDKSYDEEFISSLKNCYNCGENFVQEHRNYSNYDVIVCRNCNFIKIKISERFKGRVVDLVEINIDNIKFIWYCYERITSYKPNNPKLFVIMDWPGKFSLNMLHKIIKNPDKIKLWLTFL